MRQGLRREGEHDLTTSEPRSASLLLVHGAGSGPWVYDEWPASFPGLHVLAVDLQDGLAAGSASMGDYAERVVVLQAAAQAGPQSVILIEASPPGEVQGFDDAVEPAEGTFDPEAVYGSFPPGVSARLESSLARAERKRGISVPSLPCASLVVYGDEFRDERGKQIARLYGSEERDFPGLSHWDLVRDRRVREAIAAFVGAFLPIGTTGC